MPTMLLSLPRHILELVLSYLSFDEVAKAREVCTTFDEVCADFLNRGFRQLERKVAAHQAAIRAKLPRRESERRTHPLSRHFEVLSAVETRLSLLKMSIMRYADEGHCCFFPGKVLDEIGRVCRSVQATNDLSIRPYELLNEMRDISSMAVEHFEDVLLPMIRRRVSSAAVYSATWESVPSTSTSLPSLLPSNRLSTYNEDMGVATLYRAKQRSSVGYCATPSSHCSIFEERVKRLEQAQQLSRSRLSMSLRALSQLMIRLRETSEQNRRLEALVTAQSRKIQRLESLCATTSLTEHRDSELVNSQNSVSPEASNPSSAGLRKRAHSILTTNSLRRQQRLRLWSLAAKRARNNE